VAKSSAVIWSSYFNDIEDEYGPDTWHLLKKGNKLLLKAKVSFHVVYGFKLQITHIDPSVIMGDLALQREETLKKLSQSNLMYYNGALNLPLVLQRIAIISSSTAAGYKDFVNHIHNNTYGYVVHLVLFESAMQGDAVKYELVKQMQTINSNKRAFDAVVIIRGGGSKLDLMAFDTYEVAAAIALCPIPVLTGIGHQQDETIADLVAHTALKTPTAVAEYIIESFMRFESRLHHLGQRIGLLTRAALHEKKYALQDVRHKIHQLGTEILNNNHRALHRQQQQLRTLARQYFQRQKFTLEKVKTRLQVLQKTKIDASNYSLVYKNKQLITSTELIYKGDQLRIKMQDGEIWVQVLSKKSKE